MCEVGLKVGLSTLRRRPFCLMCGQPQPANCIIDGYGAVLSGIQTLVSPPLDLDLELSGRLNRAVKALFVIVRNPTYTMYVHCFREIFHVRKVRRSILC